MFEPLTDFVAEMEMMTIDQGRAFIIVEGERDWKTIRSVITENVIVTPTPEDCGKDTVVDCIKQLNAEGRQNVLALVDADYDRILDCVETTENLYYSESHDYDLDLLLTGILEKVFQEILDWNKVQKEWANSASRIHNEILEDSIQKAYQFGIPKLACVMGVRTLGNHIVEEDLKRMPRLDSFCKWKRHGRRKECRINYGSYLQELQRIFNHLNLEQDAKTLENERHPKYQVARGHDVIFFISLLIVPYLFDKQRKGSRNLEADIRLAFNSAFLAKMGLYSQLKSWELQHGYVVIAN